MGKLSNSRSILDDQRALGYEFMFIQMCEFIGMICVVANVLTVENDSN